MTRIYLIRHAEAEGNLYRRAQGQYDGKITRLGRRQIDALAERFRDVRIDALYSSDLSRTIATAGAIQKYHDLPLVTTERLREVCMGCWEGVTWGNIEKTDKAQLVCFESDPANWHVPGSESLEHLEKRISGAVLDIAREHDGQTVAVVSHGMAIRSLMCYAMGIPSERANEVLHGDNTAVSLLEVENGVINIVFKNDASHLPPELSTFAKQTWWKHAPGEGRNNLRFEALDPSREKELYLSCYEGAWLASHGTTEGFTGKLYLESAQRHYRADPRSLWKAYYGEDFVGLLELDTKYQAVNGIGWMSLCYLVPEARGRRFGIQLIGQAAAVYRSLGRRRLGLHTAEANTAAIGFYEYYGFEKTGEAEGVLGTLYRMELEL